MKTRFLSRRRALVVLVIGCVLGGVAYYLSRPTPVQRLQPFIGQDLRNLSEKEQIEFDGLIGQLAPEAKTFSYPPRPTTVDPRDWWAYFNVRPTTFFSPRSWYLWQVTNERGMDRLVLFQGMPLWMIPGTSSARIFVFDLEGKPLSMCEFSTGWRIDILDARWLKDGNHGFPCLLVCSGASINGRDVASQHYALLDDTFALVRLEDSTGEFLSVNYHNPNHTIGPDVPQRTSQEWEVALRSPNPAEVLRTLVWLGGDHSNPPLRLEGACIERFEDAALALETRARPGVREAVERLTRSEDRWVREAALHARKVMEGDR